jgi:hypothetical protein
LNPVDQLEHLISKVNWVNFEINSVLPCLLLVFVEKVLTCLFTPPLGNFQYLTTSFNPRPHAWVTHGLLINHACCVLSSFCFNNLIDSRLFAPEVKVIHFPYIISFLPFG